MENTTGTISNAETPKDPKTEMAVAYLENQRLMQEITQFMKIIPVLESEKPKDIMPLKKVEFPESGGVLTYMEGMEHPYKGFPMFELVERIDMLKKLARNILSGIYAYFRGWRKIKLVLLIPVARHIVWTAIYTGYRIVERFKIRPLVYCTALRELHRAFSVPNPNEQVKDQEARFMLRDLICMLLEFDNAYRYRFQDLIVELDKERLRKKPIKELIRLFEIGQRREKTQEIRDTWTLFKLAINLYLRLDRKMLKTIQNALLELDLEKIKLDEADRSYCIPRKDYVFGFMEK